MTRDQATSVQAALDAYDQTPLGQIHTRNQLTTEKMYAAITAWCKAEGITQDDPPDACPECGVSSLQWRVRAERAEAILATLDAKEPA